MLIIFITLLVIIIHIAILVVTIIVIISVIVLVSVSDVARWWKSVPTPKRSPSRSPSAWWQTSKSHQNASILKSS